MIGGMHCSHLGHQGLKIDHVSGRDLEYSTRTVHEGRTKHDVPCPCDMAWQAPLQASAPLSRGELRYQLPG